MATRPLSGPDEEDGRLIDGTQESSEQFSSARSSLSGNGHKENAEDILHDVTLETLFRTSQPASYHVHSADVELGGKGPERGDTSSTPDSLKGYLHGADIFDFIRTPSVDISQISKRQALIDLLRIQPHLRQLVQFKDTSANILQGIAIFFQLTSDYSGHQMTVLQAYRMGTQDAEDALEALRLGVEGLPKFVVQLRDIGHPFFDTLAIRFQTLQIVVDKLTPDFIKKDSDAENTLSHVSEVLSPLLSKVGTFLDFADIAKTYDFSRATFDSTRSLEFSDGWNFSRAKKGQVTNDSPRENPFTVYTGSNMSGKSFELKKQFYMQLLAQSFGHAPCREGNFELYDSFHYLDRAATDSSQDLSAFGREIMDWIQAIAEFQKKPFVCCDEGFSTTSPEDQYRILVAVDLYLRQRGARFFLATHNETFISRLSGDQSVGLYHLHTFLTADKKVTYTHKLQPGYGDSMALDVARDMGLPQPIIDGALAYLQGGFPQILCDRAASFPPILSYSPEERERLKQAEAKFHLLFPEHRDEKSVLHLFSEDAEFRQMQAISLCGAEREDGHLDWRTINNCFGAIHQFVLNTPRLTSQETMERQRLFSLLAESEGFGFMVDSEYAVRDTLEFFARALRNSDGFVRFNLELNPFGKHDRDANNRDDLISYLEFNAFLLGDAFPFQQELDAYKKLLQEEQELKDILQKRDISESGRYGNDTMEAVVTHPHVLEALNALYPIYSQGYEEFLRAKDPALTITSNDITRPTPRFLHSFASWLEHKHYLDFWHDSVLENHKNALLKGIPGKLPVCSDSDTRTFLEIASRYEEKNAEQWGGVVCPGRIKALCNTIESHASYFEHKQNQDDCEILSAIFSDVTLINGFMPVALLSGRTICEKSLSTEIIGEATRLQALLHALPPCSLFDYDLDTLRPYLESLLKPRIKSAQKHHPDDGPMPREEAFAVGLHLLLHSQDAIEQYLSSLRAFDSVHLRQIANTLQSGFSKQFMSKKDELQGRIKYSHVPKDILLRSGKKLRDMIASVYLKDGSDVLQAEFRLFEQEYAEIVRRGSGIIRDGNHSSFCERYYNDLKRLQGFSGPFSGDNFSHLHELVEWFLFQKHGSGYRVNFDEKVYARGENFVYHRDRFMNEVVAVNSDILAKFMKIGTDLAALGKKLEAFRVKHAIEFRAHKYDERRGSNHPVRNDVAYQNTLGGDIGYLRGHVDSTIVHNVLSLGESSHFGAEDLRKNLRQTTSLFLMGLMIKLQKQTPVKFNTTGEITMNGAWSLKRSQGEQTMSDVRFDDPERVKLINGANMSGKTFWLKKATVGLLWSLSTGYAPAQSATMPLVDQVIYLDRVLAKHSNNLSAFGNEITFWKDFLALIEAKKGGVTVALLDEIFSTTSPRYQAALASGILASITEKGTRTAVALHNHEMIDRFTQAHPEIAVPHYFSGHAEKSEGAMRLIADYQMKMGHVTSQAIGVARTLGFPEEILNIAEMIQ